MMAVTEIASLGIEIKATDIKKAVAELDRLENQGKKTEKSTKKLSNTMSGLGSIVTALAGSILLKKFIDTASAFESMNASLKIVTGSAEKATLAMNGILEFASKTPFQVRELTDAFIKLKALGLNPTQNSLTSFGNTASAMGKTLNQAIEAVADAATGEFERLKEFGIKARSQGDQVSFTFQGITTTVGKNAKEITDFLESIGNTQFAGAMAVQMDTIGGKVSNLTDSFDLLFVALSEAGGGQSTKGALGLMQSAVESVTNGVKNLRGLFTVLFSEFDIMAINISSSAEALQAKLTGIFDSDEEVTARLEAIQKAADDEIAIVTETTQRIIAAELERNRAKKGSIDEAGKSDIESIIANSQETLEAQKTADAIALLAVIDSEEQKIDAMNQAREQQALAQSLANLNEQKRERIHRAALKGIAMDGLANLSSLMNSQSRKLFELGKKASLATATIKGYESITSSYAAGAKVGGPVLGAAFAATAALATGVQIQNIASQQFGGGGNVSAPSGGGGASGIPLSTPNVAPALADTNAGNSLTININGGLVNEEFMLDELIPAIQNSVDNQEIILVRSDSRNGQELLTA